MPIQMKALQRHYVVAEKREYAKGDVFSVDSEREAERLALLRRAVRIEMPAAAPAPQQLHRADMTAEEHPHHPSRRAGSYRRRDMQPEE